MNQYKKFSSYLLSNQPLLWHSMSIQLTLVILILHILFYTIGYASVDLNILQQTYHIKNHFFNNSFFLYWIISGLIVLIIWGVYFFRNNAGKNLYPISRWYHHKLAVLLYIPVLLYFFVPFTFNLGVVNKTKQLVSLSELESVSQNVDYAIPFLIQNTEDYKLHNRIFPKQYQDLRYFDASYEPSYIRYNNSEKSIGELIENLQATPVIDSLFAYRVYDFKDMYLSGKDTCWTSVLALNYFLTPDSLPDFHLYHIKNYAFGNSEMYNEYTRHEDPDYLKTLEMVHFWIDSEPKKILEVLQNFKKDLIRLSVANTLKPNQNYEYLINNKFYVFQDLTETNYTESYSDFDGEFIEDDSKAEDETNLEYEKGHFAQRVDFNSLNHLLNNVDFAHQKPYFYDKEIYYVMIYLALAGVILLLYFEWGNILALVISIPVAGVFSILGAIIIAVSKGNELTTFTILLVFGAFFLIMAGRGMLGALNKYVADVSITIAYFTFPHWIIVLLNFIRAAFKTAVYRPCDEWPQTVYPFDFYQEPYTSILIYAPFVLFFISLFFVKRVLAKQE